MKRSFIIVFALLSGCFSLLAQTNIDSLEKVVAGSSPDIEKIKALNILSYEYLFTDRKKADKCMVKLELIAKETSQALVKAEALRAIADQYTDLENYEKAGEYYRQAKQLFKTINTEAGQIGYARTLLNMSIIPHIHGDFNEAILTYSEAEPILRKYNQNRFLINLYNKKCDVFEQLKQWKNALVYAEKAMKLCEKTNDYENQVRSMFTYAANSPDNKMSIDYLNRAFNLIQQHKLPDWLLFYYYFDYGNVLNKQQNYPQALEMYEKAEKMGFDLREKMGPRVSKIQILILMKNYSQAQTMLDTLLVIARCNNLKVQVRDIYNLQISLDSIHGHFRQAFLLLQKKNSLNDSLLTDDTKKRVDYLNAKYQSAQREATIQQLSDEKKIQLFWIYGSLAGVILLAVILVFIYKNQKKKRRIAEQQIEQLKKEKQLEATQAVLKGETTERTRISRELHDGLGGLLSGTKLILNNMKGNVVLTESSVNQFDHALSLLDTSITELRRVAYNMMPENLLHFGLKKALEEFCNGLNKGTGTSIRFSFFGDDNRFDLNTEVIAFRIAQELINNALKHAQATEINRLTRKSCGLSVYFS
ncbi:MAG: tetratricopeptide repeat protein [Paludibacter sp.]